MYNKIKNLHSLRSFGRANSARPLLRALYNIMIRILLVAFVLFPVSVDACPLAGAWLTDVERTADSLRQSDLIDPKKINPTISILDEWEWVITCNQWTVNHVGDYQFSDPVLSETSNYTWTVVGSEIEVKNDLGFVTKLKIESKHCVSMFDEARNYKEYKCRVK